MQLADTGHQNKNTTNTPMAGSLVMPSNSQWEQEFIQGLLALNSDQVMWTPPSTKLETPPWLRIMVPT